MLQSLAVLFRVVCITGLLFSLTLNGFVIDDKPPSNKALSEKSSEKPFFQEYYTDDYGNAENGENAGEMYDYPQRNIKSKRYYGLEKFENSVRRDLDDIVKDKSKFNAIEKERFDNDYFKDMINSNDFRDEIDDIYQNLMSKDRFLKSKSEVKGFENSYKMDTKITEDSSKGGVAKVDSQVVQKTFNGSQPVVKVAKVHASAVKEGKEGDWKLQPIESEFEVVTPAKNGKSHDKKKINEEKVDVKKGEDELEQLMIGDDYDVDALNEYLRSQLNKDNFPLLKEHNSKTAQKTAVVRKKRTVTNKQSQTDKRSPRVSVNDDDVALLKKYIALQNAENHSLMRALDLASEIEFEQEEKVGDKAKQGKLLEEQMRQMRKALSNEKTLGEIKKVFEKNLKAQKKSKVDNTKLQTKQQSIIDKYNWYPVPNDYDNENTSLDDLADLVPAYVPSQLSYRDNYLQNRLAANKEKNRSNVKYFEKEADDYEEGENMEREAFSRRLDKRTSSRLMYKQKEPLSTEQERKMMKDYVMAKLREYVPEQGGRRSNRVPRMKYSVDDYYDESDHEALAGANDYESYTTAPALDYPLYPVVKYKRNKEPWCDEAYELVNDCRLPRRRGLILDADAIGLCNLHMLCFQCGSFQGYEENDCDRMYIERAKWFCKDDEACLNQAQVLFLNMVSASKYQEMSHPQCQHPCVGAALRARFD